MKRTNLAALMLLAVWPLASCTAQGVERAGPKASNPAASAPSTSRCQGTPTQCREERVARAQDRFRKADADHNGALSRSEAENGMRGLARRFDAVDANRDGAITWEEFISARTRREACKAGPDACSAQFVKRLTERFRRSDADGDGALSRLEAEQAMPRLARRFDALDANRDGHLTLDEIVSARRARVTRPGPVS